MSAGGTEHLPAGHVHRSISDPLGGGREVVRQEAAAVVAVKGACSRHNEEPRGSARHHAHLCPLCSQLQPPLSQALAGSPPWHAPVKPHSCPGSVPRSHSSTSSRSPGWAGAPSASVTRMGPDRVHLREVHLRGVGGEQREGGGTQRLSGWRAAMGAGSADPPTRLRHPACLLHVLRRVVVPDLAARPVEHLDAEDLACRGGR